MISSVVFVAVAFVTLVAGWLGGVTPLIYASIAASVLAGCMLIASVVRPWRPRRKVAVAQEARVLVPVGDRPPRARADIEQTVARSGTVRSAPAGGASTALPGSEDAPGWATSHPEAPAVRSEDAELVEDVEDVEVEEVGGGFLDDKLEEAGEQDNRFEEAEDAELVEDAVVIGAESGEDDEEVPRIVRPQSFPRPARVSEPASPQSQGPQPQGPQSQGPQSQGPQSQGPQPQGPRILVGRPVVNPPAHQDVDGEPSAPPAASPRRLVGPGTASRPSVAGPGARSRAKPATPKASRRSTAAKPAANRIERVAPEATRPIRQAKPAAKAAPTTNAAKAMPSRRTTSDAAMSKPKPVAASPWTAAKPKPAARPAAANTAAPNPAPNLAALNPAVRKPAAAKPAAAKPAAAKPAAAKPAAAKPAAAKPAAAKPKAVRVLKPVQRPEPKPSPAATNTRPATEDGKPGPRPKIQFLGNRPIPPRSTSFTDEP